MDTSARFYLSPQGPGQNHQVSHGAWGWGTRQALVWDDCGVILGAGRVRQGPAPTETGSSRLR